VLVFTRTKHGADRVVRHLETASIQGDGDARDKTQPQRTKALQDFKDGRCGVLVATDIAQRGLDISGITHVVQLRRAAAGRRTTCTAFGRTGRARERGDAFTFMAPDEIAMVSPSSV
jgi:ATP-dependent RNA helicase RhlE